jgi:hypothetical protein
VFFVVLCLSLIGLWMRSYTKWDHFNIRLPGERFGGIGSERGIISLGVVKTVVGFPKTGLWRLRLGRRVDYNRKEYEGLILGFCYRLNESSHGWAVFFPHWFGSIITGVAAALPWMPLRFGLRALLLFYAVVAIALAVIVHFLQMLIHQAAAR